MSQDVWVNVETLRGEVAEITYTMLAAGRALADGLGGSLRAVLLGSGSRDLANRLGAADGVLYGDHPDLADFNPEAHQRALASLAKSGPPRVILFGSTAIGTDLAAGVAVENGLSMASACRTFSVDGGEPKFEALTCGGKIIAEGKMPGPCCVAVVMPGGYKPESAMKEGAPEVTEAAVDPSGARTRVRGYVEPSTGDVDISKVAVLVSVGRGIGQQENIDLAKALAEALGGEVSSSRPVVDQGWLPTTRLVGKSGKAVKPKLYLALGISGAPEHMEGVPDWETMIAVNTDERAPIFDLATYGSTVDILDLLPVLTEKLMAARG